MLPDAAEQLFDVSIARHVFLSPHFDDVPLSVGGTIALLAARNARPLTLVMAAEPPDGAEALTDFAEAHHVMWGLEEDAAGSMRGRLREERDAASILGTEVGLLPFRDAIYRGDRYQGNDRLFGDIADDESDLPERIAQSCRAALASTYETVRWYLPLAVGRHVDHQLVHAASCWLLRPGDQLWYFADQPYSLNPALLEQRLGEIIVPEISEDVAVGEVWDQRIDAVMAYRSQLYSAFDYVGVPADRDHISQALATCWRNEAAEEPVERFWIAPVDDAGS